MSQSVFVNGILLTSPCERPDGVYNIIDDITGHQCEMYTLIDGKYHGKREVDEYHNHHVYNYKHGLLDGYITQLYMAGGFNDKWWFYIDGDEVSSYSEDSTRIMNTYTERNHTTVGYSCHYVDTLSDNINPGRIFKAHRYEYYQNNQQTMYHKVTIDTLKDTIRSINNVVGSTEFHISFSRLGQNRIAMRNPNDITSRYIDQYGFHPINFR